MKFISFIITFIITINYSYQNDFVSKEYFNLSKEDKMKLLWEKISENQTSASYPSKSEALMLFVKSLDPTINNKGDIFIDGRKKLVHPVGNVAQAELVITNKTPYTGIFKGANQVIIRLSIAKKADTSKSNAEGAYGNFVPGIAMKFLRDGQPSANVMAMFSVTGQNSWNFFKHDLTNDFELPQHSPFDLQLLSRKFISETSYVTSLGLKEIAEMNEKGEVVYPVKYPYKIILKPNPEISSMFSDEFTEDFKIQLLKIPPGSIIYDIYAVDQPWCEPEKIGHLKITSKIVPSKFGDENLFFRHPLVHEDLKENPIWGEYKDQFGWLGEYRGKKVDEKRRCPFAHFMD